MAGFYPQYDQDKNLIGWQAKVRRKGFPFQSKVFHSKKEAEAWAAVIESEMVRGVWRDRSEAERTTLADLLDRYAQEVTVDKKGKDSEMYRIRAMKRLSLAVRPVATLTGTDIAKWRDERLQKVSGSTVNREINLLGHVFEMARKEWGVHIENPCRQIRRPKSNPARERRISPEEERWLLEGIAISRSPWLKPLFLLSLETGMRRSETLMLEWENVFLERRTVWLPDSKTDVARHVPLSTKAVAILEGLPRDLDGAVFPITANAAKLSWQRAVRRARLLYEAYCDAHRIHKARTMLRDLHFHDSRHEATSRAFEKGLNVMEVATVTGHKDLRSLKRYTQLRAEDVAKKLG